MSENKNQNSHDRIALALDNTDDLDALKTLVAKTANSVGVYKLGLEQFTRFGPSVLDVVRETNRKIFLDLKFHDIPNTVSKAVKAACDLRVDYLTIHTQGGVEMMKAALDAAASVAHRPKILGVTLLTSIDQSMLNKELAVSLAAEKYVEHLAQMAALAKIDGIVCSAADLERVRPTLPENFEVVTPGIRPAGADVGDQKRVATPAWAIQNGATLLVIGRPITAAKCPETAAAEIVKEISAAV